MTDCRAAHCVGQSRELQVQQGAWRLRHVKAVRGTSVRPGPWLCAAPALPHPETVPVTAWWADAVAKRTKHFGSALLECHIHRLVAVRLNTELMLLKVQVVGNQSVTRTGALPGQRRAKRRRTLSSVNTCVCSASAILRQPSVPSLLRAPCWLGGFRRAPGGKQRARRAFGGGGAACQRVRIRSADDKTAALHVTHTVATQVVHR